MQTVAPYTTVIVLNLSAKASGAIRDTLINATKAAFIRHGNTPSSAPTAPIFSDLANYTIKAKQLNLYSAGFSFHERRAVTWNISQTPIHDIVNILCIVSVYKSYACIHVSDSESKATLEREIKRQPQNFSVLATPSHVSPKTLETAFLVDAKFKALWLAGGHKQTAIKANAKQLNGLDLTYVLDPLSDQTFIAKSARAQTANSLSYGVTPGRSVIWRGPNVNFDAYCQDLMLIIDRIETAAKSISPFRPALPMLMNTCESWTGVNTAYDFCLADEDSLSNTHSRVAKHINSLFAISLFASSSIDHTFTLEAKLRSAPSHTIIIQVQPDLTTDLTSVTFTPTTVTTGNEFSDLLEALVDYPDIWICWYGSYHTITAGKLCQAKRRHTHFTDWTWYDFGQPYAFNIEKEKPDNYSDIWKNATDDSLFTWCVKSASGLLNNSDAFGLANVPCLQRGSGTWLYCDDNAGEIADFVYFHNDGTRSILGLIHAKGAHSSSPGRRAVPTPYEVVTAQATKNLVDFGNENLLTRIKSRVLATGAQKIWDAPWTSNAPSGIPAAFLSALTSNTANTELFVVIVQPHVSKGNYYETGTTIEKMGVAQEQLRTLLHALKASSSGVSAQLHIVADAR